MNNLRLTDLREFLAFGIFIGLFFGIQIGYILGIVLE